MMSRTEILNSLIRNHDYKSYLEIGLDDGVNFDAIIVQKKFSCDSSDKRGNPTHLMTSDEFFKCNTIHYDLVFVDGYHEFEQCYRDVMNSLKCLEEGGTVVVHDTNPSHVESQMVPATSPDWTGDVWKTILRIQLYHPELRVTTFSIETGMTLIERCNPPRKIPLLEENYTYDYFKNNSRQILNLVPIDIFNKDRKFIVAGEQREFFQHYLHGTWEPFTWNLFDKFLTSESIYLDVGAWIGITCIPASFKAKQCYAFEPDPIAYRDLYNTVILNNFPNLEIYNMAISNWDGEIRLGNPNALGNSMTRRNEEDNAFVVPCRSLSSFARSNLSSVDFVKIDVEGSEEEILQDEAFFADYKPIVYLSLHQFWFKQPEKTEEYIKRLVQRYGKVYDKNLNVVSDTRLDHLVFIP